MLHVLIASLCKPRLPHSLEEWLTNMKPTWKQVPHIRLVGVESSMLPGLDVRQATNRIKRRLKTRLPAGT